MITDFHNVSLDTFISLGAKVEIKFMTQVHSMREGEEERVGMWQDPLRTYNFSPALRDQADLSYIIDFYRARLGNRYTFKILDPTDYQATAQHFGNADGVRTQFQLCKNYNSGIPGDTHTYIRPIFLPNSPIQIFGDTIPITSGFTVDYTTGTGIVTFTTPPAGLLSLTWTGTFYTPVNFIIEKLPTSVENFEQFDTPITAIERRATALETILQESEIPDFVEARFPEPYAERSSIGPGVNAVVINSDSGEMERVTHVTEPKVSFIISKEYRNKLDMETILHFFLCRKGRLSGFRMKDITDFQCLDEHVIGTGNGVLTTFQLIKNYISGAFVQQRNITKPVVSTCVVYINSVAASPQPTINPATGVVTFATPPTGTISWTGTYDVPTRFDSDILSISIPSGFDFYDIESIGFIEIMNTLPTVVYNNPQPFSTIVTGCALPALQDFKAVDYYVQFSSGGSAATLYPFSTDPLFFSKMASWYNSITVGFVISHVPQDANKRTLFSHRAPGQITSLELSNFGMKTKSISILGYDGSILLENGFDSLTGYFLNPLPQIPEGGTFSQVSSSEDDDMHLYVMTFAYHGRLYLSGSSYGSRTFSEHGHSIATATSDPPGITPYLIVGAKNYGLYYLEREWDKYNVDSFNNCAIGGKAIFPASALVADHFGGRLYEMVIWISGSRAATFNTVSIGHEYLLRYWLGQYGNEFTTPTIPPFQGYPYWRADPDTMELNINSVEKWKPAYVNNPRFGNVGFSWYQPNTDGLATGRPTVNAVAAIDRPKVRNPIKLYNGREIFKGG
jgi:uncharacterized protein (TIGR02217 family)